MATKKFINLLQSHEPLMDAGDYEITVEQTLQVVSKSVDETFAPTVRKFSVFGDRFNLEPSSVHSVYPPAASLGEHSKTFPHIILNRSTLPWERSMDGGRDGIWLALLLFDEVETPEIQTLTLGEFKTSVGFKSTPSGPNDNGPFHETGDGPDDQPVSVIGVNRSVLEEIMPLRADLNFTAHSRRETGNKDKDNVQVIGPERAVLIGNRLPKSNSLSTVHLVSLENRFLDEGEFNYGNAGPNDAIHLVSLKSWSFTSVDQKFNLFGMLEHLNRVPSKLSKPYLNDQVLNLRLFSQPIDNRSKYGFQVTTKGTRLESDFSRLFDETSFLSVEVPDTAIDADSNPQLDPFPDPTAFSIAVELKVFGPSEANSHAIMGLEENGKFKPSMWYIPSIRGIEYRVTSEDGVLHSGQIPGILQDQVFTRLVWVKSGSEFQFYADGFLMHKAPAPGRIYTKDSPYLIGKVNDTTLKFFGHIKKLEIFRRTLSTAEVREIFTNAAVTNFIAVVDHLSRGMVAMPHHFRKGKKAVSWYRGPLTGRSSNLDLSLPAVASDQLVILDKTTGMFDVSYAAAWQLGRLMALEDRNFSLLLYKLKRRMSLAAKRNGQAARPHLKLGNAGHTQGIDEVKAEVEKWMRRRHLLEQVPFHYLVPEEDMLPPESIRFFHIDPLWVACLKDGAASIGRTTSADLDLDKVENLAAETVPTLSGFLLRSELVAGYPGLQVLGYAPIFGDADNPDEDTALSIARIERLSDNVLLCIFEGDVGTVDLFQKPDVLHFGLDSDGGIFSKQLRKANGANLPDNVDAFTLSDDQHWHNKDLRIANFNTMASATGNSMKTSLKKALTSGEFEEFQNFTSADFAMEMLEGAERVRFGKVRTF